MEILKITSGNFNSVIKTAVNSIERGEIIVCPTDTVYGLIADATNEKAVKKLFEIKKRKNKKAVPLFVKDIEVAKKLAKIDKEKEKVLKKIWPGKVTVILKKKKGLKLFGVGKETIGLRIPDYKLVNILLSKIKKPLTGTSANISGKPALTKIKDILKQFKCKNSYGRIRIPRGQRPRVALFACPDLILDVGNLKKSLPSTVIDLTTTTPKILRNGQKIPRLYGK